MAYLIKTTEVYRVETEEQAKNFIEEQKQNDAYEVVKYSEVKKLSQMLKCRITARQYEYR